VKTRIILLNVFIIIFSETAYSQDHDFGIWYGVNSEISVKKKLEVDLSAMIRTYHNASEIEEAFFEGGLSYKFNKYFSVAGSYRLTDMREDKTGFYFRHKLFADVKGTYPTKNFTFSARLRLQAMARTYYENEADKQTVYAGRLKLSGMYKIPDFPVNPYISGEIFCPVFGTYSQTVGKERFIAGIEYKIIKKHYIELEYIFERDFIPLTSDISIISVVYTAKF